MQRILLLVSFFGFAVMPALAQAPPPARSDLDKLRENLEKKQGAEPKPTSQPAADASTPEGKAFVNIQATLAQLPEDVRTMKPAEAQALVDRLFELFDDYLGRFPDGEHRARVLYHKALMITMNLQRHMAETMKQLGNGAGVSADQIRSEYLGRASKLVDEAGRLDPSPDFAVELDKVRGRVFFHGNDYAQAADLYLRLIEKHPEDEDAVEHLVAFVVCLEKSRQYDRGLQWVDRFIADHLSSDNAADMIYMKYKFFLYLGRLEEAINFLTSWTPYFDKAMSGVPIEEQGELLYAPKARETFAGYVDQIDFQLGFCAFALGRFEDSARHFEHGLEHLHERATSGKISNVGKVYLSRMERVLMAVKDLGGKPAIPTDLGGGWLGESLEVTAEKGKVVCMLFFPYKNARSEEFLQAVQAFYQEHWSEGFRAAWIALPKQRRDYQEQMVKLQDDVNRLGLTFPTGLAIPPDGQFVPTPYDDYRVAPGTPTIVLVDRAGKVVWYKMDPTWRDFGVARKVVERLLAEPAK